MKTRTSLDPFTRAPKFQHITVLSIQNAISNDTHAPLGDMKTSSNRIRKSSKCSGERIARHLDSRVAAKQLLFRRCNVTFLALAIRPMLELGRVVLQYLHRCLNDRKIELLLFYFILLFPALHFFAGVNGLGADLA
jgi:hypothetical protein